ncbi:hypothetical protein [Streptomyces sp. NPDC013489]|uniref:DUF6919 domain-containing protein n=1 Tax=Streptomyces sp. NPDC013489 TaxID=3155606 RepID=UPI0033EEC177
MKLWWMSRADRRRWKTAKNIADLGELMALWLEGAIASWPGYQPNCGPEEETQHLIPTLAALNRAGILTVGSQPGETGTGYDGLWWEQRAALDAFAADWATYIRLRSAVEDAGFIVTVHDPRTGLYDGPVPVTTRDGAAHTQFGGRLNSGDMRALWPVISKEAYTDVSTAIHLSIAAPEFGTAGERLWHVLDRFTGRLDEADDPWAPAAPVIVFEDEAAAYFDQARESGPEGRR